MAQEYVPIEARDRYLAACYLMGAIVGANTTSREGAAALALDLLDSLDKEVALRADATERAVREATTKNLARRVVPEWPPTGGGPPTPPGWPPTGGGPPTPNTP